MPGRQYSVTTGYRYGFNGKEKDTESPVQYDYGFRIYDPRLVRFKSVDPIASHYPELTPYQFASNRPIQGADLDGLEFENKTEVKAEVERLRQAKAKQVQASIQENTSRGILGSLWQGVKDSYRDTKNSFSKTSLRSTWNNIKGTTRDLGNMMIAKPGAAKSFSERTTNFSLSISSSITQPVTFLGTMHTRSLNDNMYGLGYYGTGVLAAYATDRFIGDISSSGPMRFSLRNTLSEKFAGGGTKLVSSEMLAQYVSSSTYGSTAGTFISPTAEINSLLAQNLSRVEIATKLGITDLNFLKGDLIRIDVKSFALTGLNLRAAAGTEVGANSLFQSGGKTIGGLTEGVVDGIPKTGPGVSAQLIEKK